MRITINNLSFGYTKRKVLDGLSLELQSGKLYVLEGANGSGKTTLGKLILCLLKKYDGEVLIDDLSIKKWKVANVGKKIGYLFQNPDMQLFANSVYEEMTFTEELIRKPTADFYENVERLLEVFGLTEQKEQFPLTLSGGEKQRLALATIMQRGVEFLILDEPTAAIDQDARAFLMSFIIKFISEGGGVLLITHERDFLSDINEQKKDLFETELLTLKEGKICKS